MRKRVSRPPRFVAIDNRAADDPALHVLALGLLTILLRARDGDDITVESISKRRKEGREALSGAMRNLVDNGYVVKFKIHGADAKWRTEFAADSVPFTPEDVAEMLGDISGARSVRVEPVHLDPRRPGDVGAAAAVDRPTGSRRSVASRAKTENPQVVPGYGKPAVGEATVGSPAAKRVKTKDQDCCDVLPSVLTGTERTGSAQPSAEAVRVLLALGQQEPRLAVAGRVLRDQAFRVDALLACGWPAQDVVSALAAAPPEMIVTVPGLLSSRISALLEHGPLPRVVEQRGGAWSVAESTAHRPGHECPGRGGECGRPVPQEGSLCSYCRVPCAAGCGEPGVPGARHGLCAGCARGGTLESPPCPAGCGRPGVRGDGYCHSCTAEFVPSLSLRL